MISAVAWIKSGVAKERPERQTLTDAEYADIMAQLDDQEGSKMADGDPEEVEEKMDEDDDNDNDPEDDADLEDDAEPMELPLVRKLSSLLPDPGEEEADNGKQFDELEEQEELEETRILPHDRLIVAGRTEDDVSYVDLYVYEQADANLYVHHDIMLPSIPLCVQPIQGRSSHDAPLQEVSAQNWVAVGTFDADLEVWDLDVLEPAFPIRLLKNPDAALDKKQKQKKQKQKKQTNKKQTKREEDGRYAVMCLSWSRVLQSQRPDSVLLLAGSADGVVRLWDVQEGRLLLRMTHHQADSKVQCVQWSSFEGEPWVFVSAAYDRTVSLVRVAPDLTAYEALTLDGNLPSDPECLTWDPWHPGRLVVGLEDGSLLIYNCGQAKPLDAKVATFVDVATPCSAVSVSPFLEDVVLVVGGRGWKVLRMTNSHDGHQHHMDDRINLKYDVLIDRTFDGRLFGGQWSADTPWLLTLCGDRPEVVVVDLAADVGSRAVVNDLLKKAQHHQHQTN